MSGPLGPGAPCQAKPPPGPSLPIWSYFIRFAGSLSTSYASFTSLNLSAPFALSLATSGWYSRAFFRKALRISSALAVRVTPKVS